MIFSSSVRAGISEASFVFTAFVAATSSGAAAAVVVSVISSFLIVVVGF